MWKYCCAHSGRSAASALAALVHAPAFTPGNDRLLLYTFRNDGNHGSLILTISPTSNTLRAATIQPLAFTGALRVEWSLPPWGTSRAEICSVVRNPAAARPPVSPLEERGKFVTSAARCSQM